MPKDRITLLLDRKAIERGLRYSQLHGSDISEVVSELLTRLPIEGDQPKEELTPTVRRLFGIIHARVSPQDYRDHLAEKHRR